MNKREKGHDKETLAADYLVDHGYEVIARNFFCRYGELDLICRKERYLIFIEVKYRRGNNYGYPEDAITQKKMCAMIKTAKYYMYKHHIPEETPCRFDMVSVLGESIRIIENCIEI